MLFIDENTSRADLEAAIVNDANLYAQFNEKRLLADGYSTEELRQIIEAWILAGDECAVL